MTGHSTVARVRKPLLWSLLGVALVAVLAVAGVMVVHLFAGNFADNGPQAECSVPAVAGAPVTMVVAADAFDTAQGSTPASAGPTTSVAAAPQVYLDAVQLQYASTINAVGLAHSVPERGRIIAVATAWQESGLRNLPSGDADSVGLFQQRSSQGWGTNAQILDPVYAAGRFYQALVKITGWQTMPLTKAAQKVQASAFPDAYAKWEPAATTLVRALSGADPLQLSCIAGALPPSTAPPTRAPLAGSTGASAGLSAVLAAAQAELGGLKVVSVSADRGTAVITRTATSLPAAALQDSQNSGAVAAWSVAHGTGFGVTAVSTGNQLWANHAWSTATAALPAGQVSITVG